MKKATGKPQQATGFSVGKYLGDFAFERKPFKDLDKIFKEFQQKEFKQLNAQQKSERINRILLNLIQQETIPSFLLHAVLNYVERVKQEKILEHYAFSHFELWLNQFSNLKPEENYAIRARIVGKWVPREEYQRMFPLGMGKTYPGTHFVTAHSSPDLDTTIASFWGWVDAFGCRVSEGLHIWNVPGGPPAAPTEMELLFSGAFGEGVFNLLAKTRTTLALSGLDLMTQNGLVKHRGEDSTLNIDHERNQSAVVLVDEEGYFLGDWRNLDVEGVRQVLMLFNSCLRWFVNYLHVKFIALFAKEKLSIEDFSDFVQNVFELRIIDCEPAKEFTEKQKEHLEDYLIKVLKVKKGVNSTFKEFAISMETFSIFDFKELIQLVQSIEKAALFDRTGLLVENRPRIFAYLEKIIQGLDKAILTFRNYVERLDVAINVKESVFGYRPQVTSYRADLDEIRNQMGNYPSLTVTYPDEKGKLIPVGVIHANDLHKPIIGTVSLRDFCNRDETKIPSYLEVISIIDHHKSTIASSNPSCIILSDSQSSNALVAELAFLINDRYSTNGMSIEQIDAQIKEVEKNLKESPNKRILQRLLQRHMNAEADSDHFISTDREFIEYLHFLYAILDDTDLLTKVSVRDIECVASLLNRIKSLALKKEVEIVSFDDLKRDDSFVASASKRILQNHDMYSLYRKVYIAREEEIERNIQLYVKGQPSTLFADTKEQNGCCRVGQAKMFAKNFTSFYKHVDRIRELWCEEARFINKEKGEIDLFIQMISTVPGAEDQFAGHLGSYDHKDEIWIWIPWTEQAIQHLKKFLNAFSSAPKVASSKMEVEFLGENAKELDQIFKESFITIPHVASEKAKKGPPIAVLHYKPGTINSRKAQISPFLPRLVN